MKTIQGGGGYQFPIGPTETSYNPITIFLQTGDPAETFGGRVDSAIYVANDSFFVQRAWAIKEATDGDNHVSLQFQWNGDEEGGEFIHEQISTFYYEYYGDYIEVATNGSVFGTDPYIVSTSGGYPCTQFSTENFTSYIIGTKGFATGVDISKNEVNAAFKLTNSDVKSMNSHGASTWPRIDRLASGLVVMTKGEHTLSLVSCGHLLSLRLRALSP